MFRSINRFVIVAAFANVVGNTSAEQPFSKGERIAEIECKELRESSGIAASRINSDVFWTHNDSGGNARLFAFKSNGVLLAACPIKGAAAVDWEDMASAMIDEKPYLIIADCGDNQAIRKGIQIYLVPESLPEMKPTRKKKKKKEKAVTHELRVEKSMRVEFSDGAHDCESVAYSAARNELILLSKSWKPFCRAYSFQLPIKSEGKVLTARPFATIPLAGVTSLDISGNDREAVVLTYAHAYLFARGDGETWGEAFKREPIEIQTPARKQGEAICFGAAGKSLFLTDERNPCPLYKLTRMAR